VILQRSRSTEFEPPCTSRLECRRIATCVRVRRPRAGSREELSKYERHHPDEPRIQSGYQPGQEGCGARTRFHYGSRLAGATAMVHGLTVVTRNIADLETLNVWAWAYSIRGRPTAPAKRNDARPTHSKVSKQVGVTMTHLLEGWFRR
jgi:hypothetical protein